MKRLKELTYEASTDEQRRVWKLIADGPRQGVAGPFPILLRRPELAEKAQTLGLYLRYGSLLPRRIVELVVLLVTRDWRAEYPWLAHARMARNNGIGDHIIDAIEAGAPPAFEQADEKAVYLFVSELLLTRRVSDATYAAAVAEVGEDWLVDIIALASYYVMVSMTMNAFDDAPPAFL